MKQEEGFEHKVKCNIAFNAIVPLIRRQTKAERMLACRNAYEHCSIPDIQAQGSYRL